MLHQLLNFRPYTHTRYGDYTITFQKEVPEIYGCDYIAYRLYMFDRTKISISANYVHRLSNGILLGGIFQQYSPEEVTAQSRQNVRFYEKSGFVDGILETIKRGSSYDS